MAQITSVIGADVTVVGTPASSGDVTVEDNVRGDIQAAGHVMISEQGKLVGDLQSKDATIRGRIEGNVRADKVTLFASCHVKGDIVHGRLAIEDGARFEARPEAILTGVAADDYAACDSSTNAATRAWIGSEAALAVSMAMSRSLFHTAT
jgi:cytoskeletal protein CcmA (bactofilin family)